MGKAIVGSFTVWRILLIATVILASRIVPASGHFIPELLWQRGLPYWVWVFANFDGVHYITIAKGGYFFNLQPFFPLYPYTIRLANELIGFHRFVNGQIISAQVVSSAAFIVSLLLTTKLLRRDGEERLTPWVITAMFLFPTAFFYTAVYNDALFLLLALLTIWWGRQRRWVLASSAGALATLTRLNGLALLFLLVAEYVKLDWKIFTWLPKIKTTLAWPRLRRSGMLAFMAIPAVFIGYLLYVERWFETWRWVFSSMHVWQQDRLTFPLQVVWRYIKILFLDRSFSFTWWIATMEFAFVIFYVGLLLYAWRKIPVSYWLFFAVSILIPSLTGTFQGMPRYGLHLYPMFLILGMILSRLPRFLALGWYLVGLVSQIVLLSLFSRGWFVA